MILLRHLRGVYRVTPQQGPPLLNKHIEKHFLLGIIVSTSVLLHLKRLLDGLNKPILAQLTIK